MASVSHFSGCLSHTWKDDELRGDPLLSQQFVNSSSFRVLSWLKLTPFQLSIMSWCVHWGKFLDFSLFFGLQAYAPKLFLCLLLLLGQKPGWMTLRMLHYHLGMNGSCTIPRELCYSHTCNASNAYFILKCFSPRVDPLQLLSHFCCLYWIPSSLRFSFPRAAGIRTKQYFRCHFPLQHYRIYRGGVIILLMA